MSIEHNIELLKHFGNDAMVVNAARVSHNSQIDPNKPLSEGDIRLIFYLAKHGHESPFFHPQVQFRIKMPFFIARQWDRHKIGTSRNEVSRRYVSDTPEAWLPDMLRARAKNIKQGSLPDDTEITDAPQQLELIRVHTEHALQTYNQLIAANVAPEMARIVLPLNTYTEWIETGSLYFWARLCRLRLEVHAQQEVREYAEVISRHMSQLFPTCWQALMTTRVEGGGHEQFMMMMKKEEETSMISTMIGLFLFTLFLVYAIDYWR